MNSTQEHPPAEVASAPEPQNPGSPETAKLAGKYLTFNLADETYGANILAIREIIGIQHITRVPECPPYLKGVINLRGQVIAVMDLRLLFGLPEKEYDDEVSIVIVEVDGASIGMIVDRVQEVEDLAPGSIEPRPPMKSQIDEEYILGMGKTEQGLIILLDTDATLRSPKRKAELLEGG